MKRSLAGFLLVGVVAACGDHELEVTKSTLPTEADTRTPDSTSDIGAPAEALVEDSAPDAGADGEATDDLESRCMAAFAHLDACSGVTDQVDDETKTCATYAKSMKPAFATLLACEVDAMCADVEDDCAAPAPTTLGEQLCTGIASACGDDEAWFDCSADGRQAWNRTGGLLTDDAAGAALACLTNDCSDVEACLYAWAQAAGLAATP